LLIPQRWRIDGQVKQRDVVRHGVIKDGGHDVAPGARALTAMRSGELAMALVSSPAASTKELPDERRPGPIEALAQPAASALPSRS